jgi:hypothetical protein
VWGIFPFAVNTLLYFYPIRGLALSSITIHYLPLQFSGHKITQLEIEFALLLTLYWKGTLCSSAEPCPCPMSLGLRPVALLTSPRSITFQRRIRTNLSTKLRLSLPNWPRRCRVGLLHPIVIWRHLWLLGRFISSVFFHQHTNPYTGRGAWF